GDRRGRACGRGGPGSGDERGGRQRPAGRYHRTRCGAEDPGPGPLPLRAAGRRRTPRRHHPGQTAREHDPGAVGPDDRGEAGIAPWGLHLVSLASTSGIAGNRGQTNYSFTKAGAIGMNRAFAPRIAAHGGTANSVAPGFIETEMTAAMPTLTRQVARRLNS